MLLTRYFDTADLRLGRAGLTLGYRTGGDTAAGTWTLRPESFGDSPPIADRAPLSWVGSAESVPSEVTRLLGGLVGHAEVHEIASLATERRRFVLRAQDGGQWGEVDDDVVTVVGGYRDGLRFRRVELELTPTGRDDTRWTASMLRALRDAGATPDVRSPVADALGVPEHGTPTLDGRSSIGDVVRDRLADGLARLLRHDYLLRLERNHPRPHDVHQARVATRRLRSDLKTLQSALDPVWLRHTRSELRWLGDVLGSVRDLDVLVDSLGLPGGDAPAAGVGSLLGSIAQARDEASAVVAGAMEQDRYLVLIERLRTAADRPPFYGDVAPSAAAVDELPSLVQHQWRILRKRARKAVRRRGDDQLHRVRIAAKQLRYAAEAAIPVMGKPARLTARTAEELQTELGEHHDAVVAERWLRRDRLAVHGSPRPGGDVDAAFTAGWLANEQRRRQHDRREEWQAVWRVVRAHRPSRWG
jgi:CHAD domain-containing protein